MSLFSNRIASEYCTQRRGMIKRIGFVQPASYGMLLVEIVQITLLPSFSKGLGAVAGALGKPKCGPRTLRPSGRRRAAFLAPGGRAVRGVRPQRLRTAVMDGRARPTRRTRPTTPPARRCSSPPPRAAPPRSSSSPPPPPPPPPLHLRPPSRQVCFISDQ